MSRPVVLFNCARNFAEGEIERDMPRLVERSEVRQTNAVDGPEMAALLADTDVLVARRDYVGRASLTGGGRLRGIVTGGVGVEKVDVACATELGIPVANSPGNTITVAESALLLMLALGKQLPVWVQAARDGIEPTRAEGGVELLGKTVGIVGYGRIGRRTAELCRAFGMKVLAYDPFVDGLNSLEEVLSGADFVSFHPVLTSETFHLLNAERLALMKPTAFVVNTSRGGVIDEPALIAALQAGQIAGAGLDVFEKEPPALDNPLLHMENVIGTPHGLSHTDASMHRCAEMTEENVLALLDGQLPPYLVNKTVQWRSLQTV